MGWLKYLAVLLLILLASPQHQGYSAVWPRWLSRALTFKNPRTRALPSSPFSTQDMQAEKPPKVLVLDVDGTLYPLHSELENEIVVRIHRFFNERYNLTSAQCNHLHREYGSTIQAAQDQKLISQQDVIAFYEYVYRGLDVPFLIRKTTQAKASGVGDASGYHHKAPFIDFIRNFKGIKYIASNSPSFHIKYVLACLGLADVKFDGYLTPDLFPNYVTKIKDAYWKPLLDRFPADKYQISLIDDSATNIAKAQSLGIKGIQVVDDFPTERGIALALGAIGDPADWLFDDAKYIESKNAVDAQAISPQVLEGLEKKLTSRLKPTSGTDGKAKVLQVLDLGAGLLSMLEPISRIASKLVETLDYQAFETNADLVQYAVAKLVGLGYELQDGPDNGQVTLFRKKRNSGEIETRVRLHSTDFRYQGNKFPADLVVGCCLADLFNPDDFVESVISLVDGGNALLYLPITFSGRTTFHPSLPAEKSSSIPSDVAVLNTYHKSLEEVQGHNLHPEKLIKCLEAHGASLLSSGPSKWVVQHGANKYLWNALVYFIGIGVLPYLGVDASTDLGAWRTRVLENKPTIHASNVDLLFQLYDPNGIDSDIKTSEFVSKAKGVDRKDEVVFVEFFGPKQIRAKEEPWSPNLQPQQVEIESICSLISSGTELKMYRGEFSSESALDVNIKGMEESKMQYPLRYGYSLVGRIVNCGEGVSEALKGRLVFSFSSHASRVVADVDSLHFVPEGVAAEDAIYLPAVETALSLVQDAKPVLGERVAVIGQGMIGLLVTAILSGMSLGSLTAVDMIPLRRALALEAGAHFAASPQEFTTPSDTQPDLTVEVSGHPKGLQAALDMTGYGGRVLIGSWYGSKPASLTLGMEFHRSHLKLIVSQVSRISGKYSDRWTKNRRFDLAWDLLKRIKPSAWLTTRSIPPEKVAEAFQALDDGQEVVGVEISYGKNSLPR